MSLPRYHGKFRGTVMNNLDPLQLGRVQVMVPDVTGLATGTWALPCVPFAGPQSGVSVVPQVGAAVWVEFEQGDPDHPIWVGGFWGAGSERPPAAQQGSPASPSIVIQTGGGSSLVLCDLPGPAGGILIRSANGASISVSDAGITLDNGRGATIKLEGPSVDVNSGALKVT